MKPSKHAFVTFWDVHAWGGMLCALVLHLLFFFGAFTLLQGEIRVWEDPILQQPRSELSVADVPALLKRDVPSGVEPPEDVRVFFGDVSRVLYKARGASEFVRVLPLANGAVPERIYLAHWLDDLHSLSIDGALWLERVAGLASVLLGLALVSGIVIHIKDLVPQLFQLRTRKGIRVFWSDLHKVLGVWGLPFLLLFAWTGALLNLDDWMAAKLGQSFFSGDEGATEQAMYGFPPSAPAPARGAAMSENLPLPELLERAQRALPGVEPHVVILRDLGRQSGTLEMSGDDAASFQGFSRVRLSLVDGATLAIERAGASETPWRAARRWLYELHYAEYGGSGALGLLLRIAYALAALGGCAVFLTGNWIWLARRDRERRHLGNRILARLTIGSGSGLCLATGVLFVQSRLLSPALPDRSPYVLAFFATWALTLVWAFLPRRELAAWWHQLAAAALIFALAPVIATRQSTAGLFGQLWPGGEPLDATVSGVDGLLLLCAAGCALLAIRLRRAARDEAIVLSDRARPRLASSAQPLGSGLTPPPGVPLAEGLDTDLDPTSRAST